MNPACGYTIWKRMQNAAAWLLLKPEKIWERRRIDMPVKKTATEKAEKEKSQ